MKLLALLLALSAPVGPERLADGLMQRYDPGVMDDTVAYRIKRGQLPAGTDAYMAVAVVDCGLLGYEVWIKWPTGLWTGPHPVADCSAAEDAQRHKDKGLAVEVSYEFAVDWSVPIGTRFRVPLDGILRGVEVYRGSPFSALGREPN